ATVAMAAANSGGFPSSNPAGMSLGMSSLSNAAADFGARTMLLALRSLAKNLRTVPGRKMVVLFSGGFPLSTENESELTATIDACNKANVAVYAVDARGLVALGGSALNRSVGKTLSVSAHAKDSMNQARGKVRCISARSSINPNATA